MSVMQGRTSSTMCWRGTSPTSASEVNFLMNITDVDDRITEAAKKDGVRPGDVVQKYAQSFLEDLRGLNVSSVTSFERVSNYIQVMIDQVSVLVQNGFAYLADGVVYFDTSKYPGLGRLSHQSKSELSLRPLELTSNKKNLLDFALWRPVILEEGSGTARGGEDRRAGTSRTRQSP